MAPTHSRSRPTADDVATTFPNYLLLDYKVRENICRYLHYDQLQTVYKCDSHSACLVYKEQLQVAMKKLSDIETELKKAYGTFLAFVVQSIPISENVEVNDNRTIVGYSMEHAETFGIEFTWDEVSIHFVLPIVDTPYIAEDAKLSHVRVPDEKASTADFFKKVQQVNALSKDAYGRVKIDLGYNESLTAVGVDGNDRDHDIGKLSTYDITCRSLTHGAATYKRLLTECVNFMYFLGVDARALSHVCFKYGLFHHTYT